MKRIFLVMVATTVLVWGPGSTGSQPISAPKAEPSGLILLRLRRSGNPGWGWDRSHPVLDLFQILMRRRRINDLRLVAKLAGNDIMGLFKRGANGTGS